VSESQAGVLIANIRLGWKGLTGTNTLAYFASSSLTKKKDFLMLITAANFIKLFGIIYASITVLP
jgi:hypothetical protein